MEDLQIHIDVCPQLYLKNPDSSELGRRIISGSIEMINKLGFEIFTIRKLGESIGSSESSIYRYFESKHTILLYLTNWYWSWIEYRLVFATNSIDSPDQKLAAAVRVLTMPITIEKPSTHIDEIKLDRIIVTESIKAYHTKEVDIENKKGYFKVYKRVVKRASEMVLEVNSGFKFPHMLISTIIEGAHQQRYFVEHLPSLTDVSREQETIYDFYSHLVFRAIKK